MYLLEGALQNLPTVDSHMDCVSPVQEHCCDHSSRCCPEGVQPCPRFLSTDQTHQNCPLAWPGLAKPSHYFVPDSRSSTMLRVRTLPVSHPGLTSFSAFSPQIWETSWVLHRIRPSPWARPLCWTCRPSPAAPGHK